MTDSLQSIVVDDDDAAVAGDEFVEDSYRLGLGGVIVDDEPAERL